jgi:conjugative relaxase-like TrwC/TraI family protein
VTPPPPTCHSRPGEGDYYAATGNPPGRWYGAGLTGLAGGAGIPPGSPVTEAAITAVFGGGVDPVTGQLLGRTGGGRRGVAGFDLTFTAPKSVSVLWALGSADLQTGIEAAHHAAIADVLAEVEARALSTRTGHAGAYRLATRGAVAAGSDHWDSRTHDPNLHTHLVIANRVQGLDGIWRAYPSLTS